LDITLDKSSNTEALIKIKLNEDDYQKNYNEKLKEYSKKASIKGFRPGKVPSSLIKKLYGKSILAEEINKLLVKSVNDYLKENDIKIIGDPLPSETEDEIDWDNQKEFEFEYNIGLVDDFNLDLNIKDTRYKIKLAKKEFEENVDNLRKQYGKMTNPEVSEDGDSIFGSLTLSTDESFSKDSILYLDKLAKKQKPKFTGVKKDDKIALDLKSLFEDKTDLEVFTNKSEKELKEIKGDFTFIVKNINRVEKADLNQELFDKVFGKDVVKNEEEFLSKYQAIIEDNLNRESEYFLNHQLQKSIIDKTKVDIPSDFYKKWILKTQENVSADELEKDFEHYLRDLKWNLIKNKISEEYKVKVENEDVIEKTKALFKEQFGSQLNEEMEKNLDVFASNYLNQNDGENYYNIYNQVRTDKIMNAVKENVKITDKEVNRAEFEKKIKE